MIRWLAHRRFNAVDTFAVAMLTSFVMGNNFWWGLAAMIALFGLSSALEKAARVPGDE
jgi:hypothetical protein